MLLRTQESVTFKIFFVVCLTLKKSLFSKFEQNRFDSSDLGVSKILRQLISDYLITQQKITAKHGLKLNP